MAHFAEIVDGVVVRVLVVPDSEEARGGDYLANDLGLGGTWVQCSYNNSIRKQFPSIGYSYDQAADQFVAPRPYPSWSLSAENDWEAPVPRGEGDHVWDEGRLAWRPAP